MAEQADWVVTGSKESHATINPINAFMEVHFTEAINNCKKELFRLGAGEKERVDEGGGVAPYHKYNSQKTTLLASSRVSETINNTDLVQTRVRSKEVLI